MNLDEKKKEIVKYLLSKDILISTAILDKLNNPEKIDSIYSFVSCIKTDKILLISEEFEDILNRGDLSDMDWMKFEESKAMHEKGKENKIYKGFKEFIMASARDGSAQPRSQQATQQTATQHTTPQTPTQQANHTATNLPRTQTLAGLQVVEVQSTGREIISTTDSVSQILPKLRDGFLNQTNHSAAEEVAQNIVPTQERAIAQGKKQEEKSKIPITDNLFDDVKIVFSYTEEPAKQDIQDFVSYYNRRYEAIEKLLRNRQELQGITSINRLFGRNEKENVSVIGMIRDKQTTKNNNLVFVIEDPTGETKLLVTKNNPECYDIAKGLVLDEVIGVKGTTGDKVIFASKIILPEIPLNKELKKLDEEVYAVFLSDIHVGSNNFLPKEFNKFLDWLNGDFGNEQHKHIARKVKYVFIIGDIVDGIGIYPGQEDELVIKDIYEQYEECAKFLSRIPKHMKVIICPGNHDAMRISEPQLPLYKDFAEAIWRLPNVILVSNPALVNIAASSDFSGFDVLMYHGYSFDYYVANVDTIRQQGGYDRADLVMKFLLQRRHLAPTHTSTLHIADTKKDPLFIDKIPDFFATGHIHKSYVSSYRNVTTICGSCWQAKTSFQEKVGHNPEPARVPVVNLQTREVKVLKFE